MKCKICKKRFALKKENLYFVVEKIAPLESITKFPHEYECFDCPKCGCQNIVGIREMKK